MEPRPPTARTVHLPFPSHKIDPDAAKVVRRLAYHGHLAYFVGGCVRDLILGRTPKDFDVATEAQPHELRYLFRNCRIIGRRFRLAHILFEGGGKVIETATFRRTPQQEPSAAFLAEEDGAEAPAAGATPDRDLLIVDDNTFGEPHEDARRRDFTMNALFYDLERREVIDYVGGLGDLERRVIRTIGDADVRFREDPVRILRAIRFCARLDLGIEPDTYDAMIAHREDILRAARPRILEEVLRLLRAGAARRSFWLAWETGVLSVMLPDVAARLDDDQDGHTLLWRRLAALDAMVARGAMPGDSVLLALLLLDPLEEALEGARNPTRALDRFVEGLREQLAVTRRMEDRLRQMVPILAKLRDGRWQTLARRECFTDAAVLHLLDCDARGLPADALREALNAGPEHGPRRGHGRKQPPDGAPSPPPAG